jgi:hypothetical protein
MNSIRAAYPYHISVSIGHSDEDNKKITARSIRIWCLINIRGIFDHEDIRFQDRESDTVTFYFLDLADAMMFKMRWG